MTLSSLRTTTVDKMSGILVFLALLLVSCEREEFPPNASFFVISDTDSRTLIYKGVKAGEFANAAEKADWKGVRKLIISGHVNNKDIGVIKRYLSEALNGDLREVDLQDAEIFEGQLINSPFTNKNLEHLTYPRKIKSTGNYVTTSSNAIDGAYWVREVIIPNEVEIIGAFIFESVSRRFWTTGSTQTVQVDLPYMSKEKYQLPNMVKEIGEFAYRYYPYEDLQLPESVEIIKRGCFTNTKLTSFTFPPKVTALPDECFLQSYNLKTIVLPAGLTSIGYFAFAGTKIEELILPDGVTQVGEGFLSAKRLKKIKWPKNLTKLGDRSMRQSSFENLHIPEQVTSLGESCFYESSTKRLWLHKNISELGRGFINGMDKLEEVHVAWTIPPENNQLFNDVLISPLGQQINKSPDFDKVKLYVPRGTAHTYRNAQGWKRFKQIIEE